MWHSDVANDFSEAKEPKQTYYMRIDEVFHEWYSTLSLVFVIFQDTQKHLDTGANAFTRYLRNWTPIYNTCTMFIPWYFFSDKWTCFFTKQMIFSIDCKSQSVYNLLCDTLDFHLHDPRSQHGLMRNFNGVDVFQAGNHITLLVETYSKVVFQKYGWTHLILTSLPRIHPMTFPIP